VESTFICLLPCKKDAARLHRTFDELFSIHAFPYIKMPLHVTLYFFPVSTSKNNIDAIHWIQRAGRASKCSIISSTQGIQYFQKKGRDFVCYLPITSRAIFRFHDNLCGAFKGVHADSLDFIPHLSLFYPDRNLTEEERDSVQKIYKDMESITFDRLALASAKKNGTHFLYIQTL